MKFLRYPVDEVGFAAPEVFCNELCGIGEQKLKNLYDLIVGGTQRRSAPSPRLGDTKSEAENFVML